MESEVYFIDTQSKLGRNIFNKLETLLEECGFDKFVEQDELIAIKMHFGEDGSTGYLQPQYVSFVVKEVKRRGGKPFLTDTNAVYDASYRGSRSNAVDHLNTALSHGFSPSIVGAPVIISGGLRGRTSTVVEIKGKHFESVEVAAELQDVDKIISLSHFKGHADTSFGGAIKNIGVGLVSNPAKLNMHTTAKPFIDEERCDRCGICQRHCPANAIHSTDSFVIAPEECICCGDCIVICPSSAVRIEWDEPKDVIQEKMCEYAYGVAKDKRLFYLNFLLNITPECDCHPWSNPSIVKDIGILASFDPVAIDQASVDLVNQQGGFSGEDKFRELYPHIDWTVQLAYGEEIGLGTRNYKLIEIK